MSQFYQLVFFPSFPVSCVPDLFIFSPANLMLKWLPAKSEMYHSFAGGCVYKAPTHRWCYRKWKGLESEDEEFKITRKDDEMLTMGSHCDYYWYQDFNCWLLHLECGGRSDYCKWEVGQSAQNRINWKSVVLNVWKYKRIPVWGKCREWRQMWFKLAHKFVFMADDTDRHTC